MIDPADKTNLLGLPQADLEQFVEGLGEKPYRARQLQKWLRSESGKPMHPAQ